MSDYLITQTELRKLFGDEIPIEAMNLIFNSPDTMTVGEVRTKLRKIAESSRPQDEDEYGYPHLSPEEMAASQRDMNAAMRGMLDNLPPQDVDA